jgi:hypothetical protein
MLYIAYMDNGFNIADSGVIMIFIQWDEGIFNCLRGQVCPEI